MDSYDVSYKFKKKVDSISKVPYGDADNYLGWIESHEIGDELEYVSESGDLEYYSGS